MKRLIITRDSNQRILKMFMDAWERRVHVVKGSDLGPVIETRGE